MHKLAFGAILVLAFIGGSGAVGPAAGSTASGGLYQNCTALHTKYPHGLGRANAHDHTSGTPVTNFTRNTRLYRIAMRHNADLDRDRDGIACEKR